MSESSAVLSYNESLLRRSDVDLLRGPFWLNDTIISFYFEFLENDLFKKNPLLLFVPPQVTQCVKITPSNEIRIFLDPLEARHKSFIFFALNDNQYTESVGGTHWSLLVFSRPEKRVFHFDSMHGSNKQQGAEFSMKILHYFELGYQSGFIEASCLQQSNGYDCGIHVLCNAENIARHVLRSGYINNYTLLNPLIVMKKRSEILATIDYLKQRQHNR